MLGPLAAAADGEPRDDWVPAHSKNDNMPFRMLDAEGERPVSARMKLENENNEL